MTSPADSDIMEWDRRWFLLNGPNQTGQTVKQGHLSDIRADALFFYQISERTAFALDEKYKVLIVDDQYVARGFFELQVDMLRRYALAASLSSAEQAVSWCMEHPVDLVIMDVVMKYGLSGLTCAKTIKNNHPRIKVILTTSTAEARWIEKAKQAGIEGFWFKEYSGLPLSEVMDRVMAGGTVYPEALPNPEFGDVRKLDLSQRELEVLGELTRNLTNEEIAANIGLSPKTVKRHIENLLAKTGYKNRIDLAVNARLLGLVVHEDEEA